MESHSHFSYNNATNWAAQAEGFAEGVSAIEVYRSRQVTNAIYFGPEKFQSEIPNLMILAGFIFAISVIRYVVKNVIILGLIPRFGISLPRAVHGLQENAWYTGYYLVAATPFGLAVYLSEPWSIWDSQTMWESWPLQPFSFWFRMYYLMELGFYGSHLIALHLDTMKKDYVEMLIHHFATFGLVFMSYWTRYHRVGLVILLLHNFSDIFLYLGKSIDFYGKGTDPAKVEVFKQTMLVLFAASFFAARLLLFPFVVIRSTLFESTNVGNPPFYVETNVLLIVLQLLHVFWFYLIVVVAAKSLRGTVEDIRELDVDETSPSDSSRGSVPSSNGSPSKKDRGDKSETAKKRR